ncbi:hypothetical protein GGI35DRAFT_285805 [Trichoderma velutinum]
MPLGRIHIAVHLHLVTILCSMQSVCPSIWPSRAAPRLSFSPPSPSLSLFLLPQTHAPMPPIIPHLHLSSHTTPDEMNMDRRADDATASATTHEPQMRCHQL